MSYLDAIAMMGAALVIGALLLGMIVAVVGYRQAR